jgi:hypothetical protein
MKEFLEKLGFDKRPKEEFFNKLDLDLIAMRRPESTTYEYKIPIVFHHLIFGKDTLYFFINKKRI